MPIIQSINASGLYSRITPTQPAFLNELEINLSLPSSPFNNEFDHNAAEPIAPNVEAQLLQTLQEIMPGSIGFDKITINKLFANQDMQSSNFVTGVGGSGWRIKGNGNVEFNEGNFRGTIVVGSLHIPDQDTTANSFHVQTDGDSFWGTTDTLFNANNDNALAYVLKTGFAKFQNINANGRTFASEPVFGDGATGATTIGAGTTTLTSDVFYTTLTVNGTLNTAGYKVFCSVSATINNGGVIEITAPGTGGVGADGANAPDQTPGQTGGGGGTGGSAAATGSVSNGAATPTTGAAGANGGTGGGGGEAGANGGNGTTSPGVDLTNAIGSNGGSNAAGAAGGNGGSGTTAGGNGGLAAGVSAGGTITAPSASVRNLINAILMVDSASTYSQYRSSATGRTGAGGAGGGGGGGPTGGGGGKGGGSGGNGGTGGICALYIRTLTVNAGGTIRANGGIGGAGGKGGNGAIGQGGNGGGGGGASGGSGGSGGTGGVVLYIYQTLTNNGTIEAAGGAGGAGGAIGTGGAGAGGQNSGLDGSPGNTGATGAAGQVIAIPFV